MPICPSYTVTKLHDYLDGLIDLYHFMNTTEADWPMKHAQLEALKESITRKHEELVGMKTFVEEVSSGTFEVADGGYEPKVF